MKTVNCICFSLCSRFDSSVGGVCVVILIQANNVTVLVCLALTKCNYILFVNHHKALTSTFSESMNEIDSHYCAIKSSFVQGHLVLVTFVTVLPQNVVEIV
jgi:hypothetical protein